MDYSKKIADILKTLGEQTYIELEGTGYLVYAIIQPLRYKNKMYLEQIRTELGFKDGECFLYLGPKEIDFAGKERYTVVSTRDRDDNVSRADRISLNDKLQYIWAILTPRVESGDMDES